MVGISVLHHVRLVSFLDRFGDDLTLDIPFIDKIILEIPVGTVQRRPAKEPFQRDIAVDRPKFHHLIGDIPAKDAVDDRFHIAVAVCVELRLPIDHIFKRNIGP